MNFRDLVPWTRGERDRESQSMHPVVSLHRDVNRLFDDAFRSFADSQFFGGRGWPSMEVEETEKEYRVTAELPGLDEKDVEVLLHDGVLTVRGEKKVESEDRNRIYGERFYGRLERHISLDRDVDESAVKAAFKKGILTVTVPKNAKAVERTKRIPIASAKAD
jgi:HSP20 family protein